MITPLPSTKLISTTAKPKKQLPLLHQRVSPGYPRPTPKTAATPKPLSHKAAIYRTSFMTACESNPLIYVAEFEIPWCSALQLIVIPHLWVNLHYSLISYSRVLNPSTAHVAIELCILFYRTRKLFVHM